MIVRDHTDFDCNSSQKIHGMYVHEDTLVLEIIQALLLFGYNNLPTWFSDSFAKYKLVVIFLCLILMTFNLNLVFKRKRL